VLLAFAPRASAAPSVQAHIEWHGDCQDDRAVSEEMLARGVRVYTSDTPNGEGPFLWISVQPNARVGWAARLELEGAGGSRESRLVEARNCSDLQRAVAWVLATFAREASATAATSERTVDVPAGSETGQPATSPVEAASAPSAAQSPSLVGSAAPDERARSDSSTSPSASRFALGTSFVAGIGWLPTPALGPSVHAEYGPRTGSRPTLRLSVARLASLPFERGEVSLRVDRIFANASMLFASGLAPLKLKVALEAGTFRGAGTGPPPFRPGSERLVWLAGELGAELRFAFLRDVLHGEFGASGAYAPLSYSLEASDGQSLVVSKNLEFRVVAGLAVTL